jgi:hypothetical protein
VAFLDSIELAESSQQLKGRLKAGVFSAAAVRKARAGVRIAARRVHVRFGARGRPPAGRVFLGLAHLHAAAADFGFCAAAIAAASWDGAQQARRVS